MLVENLWVSLTTIVNINNALNFYSVLKGFSKLKYLWKI